MALNSSGPISLGGSTSGQSINLELGQSATATVSLNDSNVRSLAGVPSGAITMPTNFWGASTVTADVGLFFFGYDSSGNPLASTEKYTYATLTRSAGTSMPVSAGSYQTGAACKNYGINAKQIIFPVTTNSYKYTFNTDVVGSGSAMAYVGVYGSAVGNTTFGIWSRQSDSTPNITSNTDKYIWTSEATSATSAINQTGSAGCAIGSNSCGFGLFAGGVTSGGVVGITTTSKFTWSSEAWSFGGNLAATTNLGPGSALAGVGNATVGLIAGGYNDVPAPSGVISAQIEKYTYSTDTAAYTTNMTTSRFTFSGTGKDTLGLLAGGQSAAGTILNNVDSFTYSSNAVASITALSTARQYNSSLSPKYGGMQ